MTGLAICDTSVLINSGLHQVVLHGVFKSVNNVIVICKVVFYVGYASAQLGVFIILAIMVERVIVVTKPLKAAIWFSTRKAVIMILILALITFAYNGPRVAWATALILYQIECVITQRSGLEHTVYSWLDILLNGIIPLVSILAMNTVIVYFLYASKQNIIYDHSSKDTVSTLSC